MAVTPPLRRLALIALALGLLAGCGGGGEAPTEVGSVSTVEGTTLDGEPLALSDYAGQDVLLWFWAPW